MKVSKTVSIDLDLLQQVLDINPKFSEVVTLALENWLISRQQSDEGNIIHFSQSFRSKIEPKIIWQLMTFDGLIEWVDMLEKVDYITENRTGLGAKCILYGKVNDIEATSTAEIIEYREYGKLVISSEGEFTLFISAILNPRGSYTEVRTIIVVSLSNELATDEIRKEINHNLNSAFKAFRTVASSLI